MPRSTTVPPTTPHPARHGRAVLLTVLTLLLTLSLALPAGPAAAAKRGKPAKSPTSPTPVAPRLPAVGVSTEGAPGGPELQELITSIGQVPDEVMWFVAWSVPGGFPSADAARVRALGATPVITWEPWDPRLGAGQTTYTPRSIAQGRHDAYLRQWARGIRAFGSPVVLRFAHEMNGTWYPWSPGVNDTTAADVVGAWRRVHAVLVKERATNAVLRWSPNVPFPGSTPMAQLWPGAGYVGQVGLDGYNWAGHLPGTQWLSFREVFTQGVQELGRLSPLPVHVSETATPELGADGTGDKAAWIRDMFAALRSEPRLAGITWFHYDKELDWRITSSAEATAAFREGMSSR